MTCPIFRVGQSVEAMVPAMSEYGTTSRREIVAIGTVGVVTSIRPDPGGSLVYDVSYPCVIQGHVTQVRVAYAGDEFEHIRALKGGHTGHQVTLARNRALAAGYYIREGCYAGTTDDRLGRWYVGHKGEQAFRPWGRGHDTQSSAWLAAAESASWHLVEV